MGRTTTALLAGASLVVAFAVAELTGVRALGGAVLLVAAAACAPVWWRVGRGTAAVLLAVWLAAFVGSHLLADAVGAWPAVLVAAAVTSCAALAVTARQPVHDR